MDGTSFFMADRPAGQHNRDGLHALPLRIFRAPVSQLRARAWLASLVVLLGLGAAFMQRPFWSDTYLARPDLVAHVYLAASAAREIQHGQWLLSFLNDATVGFQPWFRDYSVLPYLLTVPLQLGLGLNAYKAILVVEGALFVVAGVGVFAVCRYFRAHPALAVTAGVAYGLSPYALDDVLLRAAFPEWTVVALLPATFYCLLRCYASRGRRCVWPTVILVAALLLTHKIVLPWFFCACALYMALVTVAPGPRQTRRWTRLVQRTLHVVVPILAGFLLTAPYWLEAYVSASRMLIGGELHSALEQATQGWQILLPIWRAGAGAEGAGLGLKLGAPTTLGIALALVCGVRRCAIWAAGAVALMLALFMAAGPGLWAHVPSPFIAVQFPYRLLSVTNLFGILGLALTSNRLCRARIATPAVMRVLSLGLLLLAVGTTVEFYRADHGPGAVGDPVATLTAPNRNVASLPGDYIETPPGLASNADPSDVKARFDHPAAPPDSGRVVLPRDEMAFHGYTGTAHVTLTEPSLVILPAAFSSFLHVDVWNASTGQTQAAPAVNDSGRLAVALDPGTYTVQATRDFFAPALAAFWIGVALVVGLLVNGSWGSIRKIPCLTWARRSSQARRTPTERAL